MFDISPHPTNTISNFNLMYPLYETILNSVRKISIKNHYEVSLYRLKHCMGSMIQISYFVKLSFIMENFTRNFSMIYN